MSLDSSLLVILTTLRALRLTAAMVLAGWLWQTDDKSGGRSQLALWAVALLAELSWFGAFTTDVMGAAPWSLGQDELRALMGIDLTQRWLLRLDLALALGLALLADRRRLAGLLAVPWLALLALEGHASASGGWAGVLVRFAAMLHIVTAAFWIGGGLALARVRLAAPAARRICRSYGEITLNAAILLLVSGGLQFLAIAGGTLGTVSPRYLLLSGAKLVLFAILVAIGARNRYRLAPLLRRLPLETADALAQSLLAATLLGVAAILLGSLLGGTDPGPP